MAITSIVPSLSAAEADAIRILLSTGEFQSVEFAPEQFRALYNVGGTPIELVVTAQESQLHIVTRESNPQRDAVQNFAKAVSNSITRRIAELIEDGNRGASGNSYRNQKKIEELSALLGLVNTLAAHA